MGEGEPAPTTPNLGAPEYTIKIFISGNSGSKEVCQYGCLSPFFLQFNKPLGNLPKYL